MAPGSRSDQQPEDNRPAASTVSGEQHHAQTSAIGSNERSTRLGARIDRLVIGAARHGCVVPQDVKDRPSDGKEDRPEHDTQQPKHLQPAEQREILQAPTEDGANRNVLLALEKLRRANTTKERAGRALELQKCVRERDEGKREQMYKDLQKKVMDEGPFIIMFQETKQVAERANVKNFVMGPTQDVVYYNLTTK